MKQEGYIEKGWGSELIWVTNNKYCGKFLRFHSGKQFSMHFHKRKEESWFVLSGEFQLKWIDTKTAQTYSVILYPNDTWTNKPLVPHQLICIQAGEILEVSTPDSIEDNYRVIPGDSQR